MVKPLRGGGKRKNSAASNGSTGSAGQSTPTQEKRGGFWGFFSSSRPSTPVSPSTIKGAQGEIVGAVVSPGNSPSVRFCFCAPTFNPDKM